MVAGTKFYLVLSIFRAALPFFGADQYCTPAVADLENHLQIL